jgi:hypothetical protein
LLVKRNLPWWAFIIEALFLMGVGVYAVRGWGGLIVGTALRGVQTTCKQLHVKLPSIK